MPNNEAQPTQTEIKLLIENALLQNNEKLVDKFNSSIKDMGIGITKAVNDKTDAFIVQITEMATRQGEMKAELENQKTKLTNLWAKVLGLTAAGMTVGGFLGFFIEQIINKSN